jgi:hypothetical protein
MGRNVTGTREPIPDASRTYVSGAVSFPEFQFPRHYAAGELFWLPDDRVTQVVQGQASPLAIITFAEKVNAAP